MFNYADVEKAKEVGARPEAGGYVMQIVAAEDVPSKEYIKITLDYVEGDFKNYGKQLKAATGWDTGYITYYASYKQVAMGRMKKFLRILEDGNNGKFSGKKASQDVKEFLNKGIGIVTVEEEYTNNQGEIKTRIVLGEMYLPNEIREGKFKKLEKRIAKQSASYASAPSNSVADDELPF